MSNVTYYRDWNDGLVTNQTNYSTGSGTVTNPGTYCKLTPSSTSTDVKTWLDFVPNCVDFDATFSVIFPAGCGTSQQMTLMYRTTYKGSANDTYAYVLSITQIAVGFGHGSNSSSSSWTSLGTTTISQLANDTWHTIRVVVTGTYHSIYVNGNLINTWTDSTYTNAGSVGFRLWAASSTTYLGVDNFTLLTSTTTLYVPPVASLVSGTYITTKSVGLSSPNSGTIYYTLDGSTPTTASLVYSAPIAISSTTVLKAIQAVTGTYISGSVLTDVSTYTYTFISTIPTPIITVGTGGSLVLSDTEPAASILYTLFNVPPTVATAIPYNGTVYSQTTSYTVTAVAYLDGIYSNTATKYVPVKSIAPTFGPLSLQLSKHYLAALVTNASLVGYLPDGPKVSVSGGGGVMPLGPSFGMKISDGSILQLTQTKYLGLQHPKGKRVRLTYGLGDTVCTALRLDPQQLVQNDVIGSLNIAPVVNNDGPLSLRPHAPKYTWDVSIPDGQSIVDATVQSQWTDKVTELPYRIYGGQPTVATPTITPASGAYHTIQTVVISCSTLASNIHYTLDGSSPTVNSTLYTGPFQLAGSVILSVLATHADMFPAQIVQRTYAITVPLEPIIFPPSGTYGATITCALSSELPGATIYYTVDGTEPTVNSTIYTAPFLVSSSATVKAFATKPNHNDSATTDAVYKLLKWFYNGEGGWKQASAVLIAKNGTWKRLL